VTIDTRSHCILGATYYIANSTEWFRNCAIFFETEIFKFLLFYKFTFTYVNNVFLEYFELGISRLIIA
jgi:hypothetical protein